MERESSGSYIVYVLAGRRIFSCPATPRQIRLAALSRDLPVTSARKLAHRLLRFLMWTKTDGLAGHFAGSLIEAEDEAACTLLLQQIYNDLGIDHAKPVAFWPTRPDRRRRYLHIFNDDIQPIAFAKIAFDESNRADLRREAETLRQLQTSTYSISRIPAVLSFRDSGVFAYLLMEPIPLTGRAFRSDPDAFPARCVAEFSKPDVTILGDSIARLSWWDPFRARLTPHERSFAEELYDCLDSDTTVCRVHGNFGPSNLVHHNDHIWIFDWEDSRADGPTATDEISFYLGVYFGRILRRPIPYLMRFARRYLHGVSAARRRDVTMALSYLFAHRREDAALVLRHWDKIR